MAPPQQAGKFKPRKPSKKIRVGATTSSAETGAAAGPTPDTERSSHAAAAAAAASASASERSGRGRGGRGRSSPGGRGGEGRGEGRGGRGRGRGGRGVPIQQGQAFFVAAPAPAKKSSLKSGGAGGSDSRTAAVVRRLQAGRGGVDPNAPGGGGSGGAGGEGGGRMDETAPQEEIVGMMDEAIGAPGSVPDGAKSSSFSKNFTSDQPGEETAKAGRYMEDETGFTYDSDSSREEQRRAKGHHRASVFMPQDEPLCLPFPPPETPVGIGNASSDIDPALSITATSTFNPAICPSSSSSTTHDPTRPSPFADVKQRKAFQFEKDTWFLVQFPTRLPPLRSTTVNEDNNNDEQPEPDGDGDGANNAGTLQQAAKIDTAEVATPPVRVDCFDNAMSSAIAGRMGKIQVYKSGKTVLVLTAADGSKTHFNITEGLACSFQQQAAIIDTEKSTLVQLGKVGKTLVVTPDL
ncbi:hypothetical protein ACA910_021676 [Epithemia clementina (nom. ined.)]